MVKSKHINIRIYIKEALFVVFLVLFNVLFCLITKKTIYMNRLESYSDNVVSNDSYYFVLTSEGNDPVIFDDIKAIENSIKGATLLEQSSEQYEYRVIYTEGMTDIFEGKYEEIFDSAVDRGAVIGTEVRQNYEKVKRLGEIYGNVEDYGIPVKRKAVFTVASEGRVLYSDRVYVISSRYALFEKSSLKRLSEELAKKGIQVRETSSGHIKTGDFVSNIRFVSTAYLIFFFIFIVINMVTVRIWNKVRKNWTLVVWICGEKHPRRKNMFIYMLFDLFSCLIAVVLSGWLMDRSEYEALVAILVIFLGLIVDVIGLIVSIFEERRRISVR